MRSITLCFFLFLASCTSVEFVRKDLTPRKQGVLRYSPTSSADREKEARDKVTQKATEFCGGAFQIVRECQAREDGGGTGFGTGIGFGGGGAGVMLGTSTRKGPPPGRAGPRAILRFIILSNSLVGKNKNPRS